MECVFVCALLIFSSVIAVDGVYSAKGYYCRDPDTGKLYPANTTWPSTTFCGSYTCKLRKKNENDQPKRQFNNTTGEDTFLTVKQNCTQPTGMVMDEQDDKTAAEIEKIIRSENDDVTYEKLENFKSLDTSTETNNGDRYLTDAEIKALTSLLQNVKKSDLEAILEVYNLAQDIYKEMDKNDNSIPESIAQDIGRDDMIREIPSLKLRYNQDERLTIPPYVTAENKKSYWYEPLTSNINKKAVEMIHPPPVVPTNAQKVNEQIISNLFQKELKRPKVRNSQGFFEGTLNSHEFSKLPYVFPMSSFQRVASYMHQNGITPQANVYVQSEPRNSNQPTVQTQKDSRTLQNGKNCKADENIKKLAPWLHVIQKPLYDLDNRRQPILTESRINAQTLQYPLTYIHYNFTNVNDPRNAIVSHLPLVTIRNQDQRNPSYFHATYLAQLPIYQPNMIGEVQGEEQRPIDKRTPKIRSMPDWQTEPLSANDLKEVKANIAKQKFLPYPLRKRMNIERVGKLLRLDDLKRNRRHIGLRNMHNRDDYEVYIEKSTCQTDTEPGFFRMGNTSQPFPACCPQRIGS